DTVGDACDNCPLISNTTQRAVGDLDAIGDACDPHPADDGDCLIVVDTFEDPARFLEHWQVITLAGSTSSVTAELGRVRIRPSVSDVVALAARGLDGNLLRDVHDVHFRGNATVAANGNLYAVTAADVPSYGFYCGLRFSTPLPNIEIGAAAMTGGGQTTLEAFPAPVDSDFVIRLFGKIAGASVPDACRVDYGVSVGTLNRGYAQRPTGWSGIRVIGTEAEITGIALIKRVAGSCPPPIVW
ncbi:MAG: hypothetical protein H6Q90_7049, partial [Deltaproteobacteria bacterium]|nr:hypothetical protein [Deltaproteobacteria bacterium]